MSGYEQKANWDVAIRYQDLKRLGNIPDKEKQKLKLRAVKGILERAHALIGAVLRPEKTMVTDYPTFLEKGSRGELDVLSTLEESLGTHQVNLRFETKTSKEVDIALLMDASLSMTGEKIALLALSSAVVCLCVPSARLSLMGFDSRTRWIKRFGEDLPVEKVVERVLELPAGGFTNLELALSEALNSLAQNQKENANIVLISDGKYTEGSDPLFLANRFRRLHVLKIGRDQAGRELLLDLVHKGNGKFFEARRISDLPRTMYSAMRTILR